MKLIRLELHDDFRSLKSGFKLEFLNMGNDNDEFNPYCMVGRNGSGKSNVLEILALIFYQLNLVCLDYLPDIFEEGDREDDVMDAYLLEYYIIPRNPEDPLKQKQEKIKVIKEKGERVLVYKGEKSLLKSDIKNILPEHIIAYSSGENEILSLPFLKMKFIQYDEYRNSLINKYSYASPESKFIYLDNTFSQAIFLCNFLFGEKELLGTFEDMLGITATKQFTMIISKGQYEQLSEEYIKNERKDLFDHLKKIQDEIESYLENTQIADTDKSIIETSLLNCITEIDDPSAQVELTTLLEYEIEKLKSCATMHYYDEDTEKLYLDFYVDDEMKKAFKLQYGDAFTLFKVFQILITLNSYQVTKEVKDKIYESDSLYAKGRVFNIPWEERIFRFKDFWIKKGDTEILSKSLSDGEHQFLHSIGLASLYKGTPSLFLLDEPETHFNPSWRANYISTLRKCFQGGEVFPEVLITSHSPFIVSDSKQENVLLFEKDDNNIVRCKRPEINTFGASVNKITFNILAMCALTVGHLKKNAILDQPTKERRIHQCKTKPFPDF